MLLVSSERETHYASDLLRLTPDLYSDAGVEQALSSLLEAVEARREPREDADCEDETDRQIRFQVLVAGKQYAVTVAQVSGSEIRPVHRLSTREREIAYLIMQGLTNKAIAVTLKLRPCTVSTYNKRLFLKLNVNTRSQLVAKLLTISQFSNGL